MKYTYFIQEGEEGAIKIGTANNPDARLAQLQTSSSKSLNLLLATTLVTEREMHAEFSKLRIRGEWFMAHESLIARMAGITASHRLYPFHCWSNAEEEKAMRQPASVALADLPETTKDYLISLHTATGRPIAELIRELLNRTAETQMEAATKEAAQ